MTHTGLIFAVALAARATKVLNREKLALLAGGDSIVGQRQHQVHFRAFSDKVLCKFDSLRLFRPLFVVSVGCSGIHQNPQRVLKSCFL